MALGKAEKKYFQLNKGINTEASLLNWPDGYTIDEQNFDLLPDGSRRRRPVISVERGDSTADSVNTVSGASAEDDDAYRIEFWNTVNNDATKNFIVLQVGYFLYFFDRPDPTLSQSVEDMQTDLNVDLRGFRVEIVDPAYSATDTQIRQWPVDITFGNGRMFVVGKHIEPFFVEYDPDADTLTALAIDVQERDFIGVEDGVATTEQPATLTTEHQYNLHNRGWTPNNYEQYFDDIGSYPSKAQIMFRGMQRETISGINVDDGIKQFSSDKLFAELFQDSSAPQGHMRLNTFDTRQGFDPSSATESFPLTNFTGSGSISSTLERVEFESTAHGLSVGQEIFLVNVKIMWFDAPITFTQLTYNGSYTVTHLDGANKFSITMAKPGSGFDLNGDPTGYYTLNEGITFIERSDDDTDALRFRFTSTAFFAGRIWYAGGLEANLGNRVYFSQISEDPLKAGRCYQSADPTSEFISDLIATDGGVLVIPEMVDVQAMIPFGHNLIVFARNGVWQIGPGELGIFSPTAYSVRKVSDNGACGRFSAIVAEDVPMYWGADGIYAISQDENSGYLIAQNITRDVINSLFLNIPFARRQQARAVYDFYRKRVFWFYTPDHALQTAVPPDDGEDLPTTSPVTPIIDPDGDEAEAGVGFTHALIFDLRLGAWTKWAFHTSDGARMILEPFSIENDAIVDNETRIKMVCKTTGFGACNFREFRSDVTGFSDFGITASRPDAFIATGPDSLGEPSKYRYAPYVTCFFKRMEGAACYMQARWDWARGTISGKMSNFFSVYRETKPNPNAFAMTVTKNKIPGRGRNLFLFFKVTGTDDAWLDGYTVTYDVLMKE